MKEQYKLYKGDCLEIMDQLIEQGIKVDAIITDPPYGTTACKWDSVIPFDEMWERLNKLIKDKRAIILFGDEPFSSTLRMSNIKNYKYDWVWDKMVKGGAVTAKIKPMKQTEYIHIFGKGKILYNPQMVQLSEEEYKQKISKLSKKNYNATIYNRGPLGKDNRDLTNYDKTYPNNIISINKLSNECNSRNRVHPTQKPVELMEYLIKTYTNEGEVVLDFTAGSGSTGVACINTGRKFIGIELDENYFNIAKNRIEEAIEKKNNSSGTH